MLLPVASFTDVVLAVHILGVVAGFGATFAYPLVINAGSRLDPSAMPWFFRMMALLQRRLVYPGLFVVLVCGIYLAAKEDQFSSFYVGWGLVAVIAIGAVEGAVMAPRVRTLISLSERDLGAAAPTAAGSRLSAFSFSADYRAALRQLSLAGGAEALIVVVTVLLMATHAGA